MCSIVSDSVTPWTVGPQAPLSMEFSRQEYWSGLPFLTPRDLPDPRIELASLACPALAGRFLTTSTTWEAHVKHRSKKRKVFQDDISGFLKPKHKSTCAFPPLGHVHTHSYMGSTHTHTKTLCGHTSEPTSEVAQSCPTLFDPMDCSLPGSSFHGILRARVLEWVAISFSKGSS